jgi:DNA helicase-2/ATP-dependent DNA helicase PcrA
VGEEPSADLHGHRRSRDHEPPLPADSRTVFREYEKRKAAAGAIDFEDLLERAIQLLDEDRDAQALVRERWRSFTVDEYQDVNVLQQSLLDLWLGERDDVCVVGDDYQSIYGFTGASAEWLLALPERFPHAHVVRLEQNYRSTPQVLELANRLVPKLGGSAKTLRATLPDGPEPDVRPAVAVAKRIGELAAAGVPLEEQAVLVRTNARAADFEEELHDAGIPFQGASLLARDAARRLLKALPSDPVPAAEVVRSVAVAQGWLEDPPEKLGEREQTRQADLARLVRLAEQFDGVVPEFVEWLRERFGASAGRGVHLLTLHRAKGLEFEAVHLPRLEENELPHRRADVDEERRLLYVGLTRAKRHLLVTWSGKPSRFLAELGASAARPPTAKRAAPNLGELPPASAPARVAPSARRPTRSPRLRRLPQRDARGDRRPAAPNAVRARARPGRRPGEARALRRGSPRRARTCRVRPYGSAERSRSSSSCGSRFTRSPPDGLRFSSWKPRGSVSTFSRPSRISSSSTPPSLPPNVV